MRHHTQGPPEVTLPKDRCKQLHPRRIVFLFRLRKRAASEAKRPLAGLGEVLGQNG